MSETIAAAGSELPITFQLPSEVGATTAAVVGDFNGWDPASGSMVRGDDGSMRVVIDLPVGRRYQYRFLIDGDRWENDWRADDYAPNAFGGDDSVLDLTERSRRVTPSGR